jgi:tuberculosinol/isotuberculosinol synthase
MTIIDQETFLKLSTPEVAKLVRAAGPQVCVLPINGSRRWFLLEYGDKMQGDSVQTYINLAEKRHLELYQICFSHGLDTILTPVLGSKHLLRSGNYLEKIGVETMIRLATHPDYLAFYQEYKICVRFYGNYRKQLAGTAHAYLINMFDQISQSTAHNAHHKLFYGLFANDATEAIAELSVQYWQKTGRIPTRNELVEMYYGEYVEPASLFIGFSKLKVYDYPLLGLGDENLYFTVAPTLYLNSDQLRAILYDHIYSRNVEEIDYAKMSKQDFLSMRNFYKANYENTLGVGEVRGGIWYPLAPAPE